VPNSPGVNNTYPYPQSQPFQQPYGPGPLPYGCQPVTNNGYAANPYSQPSISISSVPYPTNNSAVAIPMPMPTGLPHQSTNFSANAYMQQSAPPTDSVFKPSGVY